MPEDGLGAVLNLIESARSSLRIKMFSYNDPDLVQAAVTAHERGVGVSVLLNPAKFNGLRLNDGTFETFRSHGIEVDWTNPAFTVTHEKSMVVDDSVALISTFNFVQKYFTSTRDYGLLITDRNVLADITACFDADRRRVAYRGREEGPVAWGNSNARRTVAGLIEGAEKRILIQHPKLKDEAIMDRILAATQRGVNVHFLCGGHHGIEEWDLLATLSNQRILARAGVHLRKQRHVRLHAKMIMVDGARAMIGSMNIDRQAYDDRRELGIVFDDASAVARLKKWFEADWHDAHRYEPEDPLATQLAAILAAEPGDACGKDPVLTHD